MRKTQRSWLEKATETAKFHAAKCKENPRWLLADTSQALNRSFGSVSQDLLVVSWLKTHPDIGKFKYYKEALEFIRHKKRHIKLDISYLD